MDSIQCEFDGLLPDFTFVTEADYRRMTEDGIVKTLFRWFYDVFSDESDPSRMIRFICWQMDKLDRLQAHQLYEYIHFGLKHDKANHPYCEQWQELAESMMEYIQKLEEKRENERKIVYVCPARDHRVYCLFSNGQWRVWDASCMVEKHPMKHHMEKDPNFFNRAIAVINDTLAWDRTGDRDPYECIDIDPGTIWAEGQPMSMDELVKLADNALNQERKL